MNKSYKGVIPVGEQERIRLSTNDGLTGYRIKQFQLLSTTPGANSAEYVGKIYNSDQTGSIAPTVSFGDPDLLAVDFLNHDTNPAYISSQLIIFDNRVFNQDIYVTIADASGGTVPCNYYIELEQIPLTEDQALVAIIKDLRSNQ